MPKLRMIDLVVLFLVGLWAISTFVIAIAAVSIAVDLNAFVNGDAWDAPWLNVITRGPVQ